MAYLITGDAAEAEDAAQTGFVKAWLALKSFRTGAPFRPWLLQIVANEARNRRTARSRRPAIELDTVADSLSASQESSPEASAITRDLHGQLVETLNRLRSEDRAVIVARYFLDLSEAEMADMLGCRRGTVKSRLSRAMGRLRQNLGTRPDVDWRQGDV